MNYTVMSKKQRVKQNTGYLSCNNLFTNKRSKDFIYTEKEKLGVLL